jgi:hypothetical protein
MPGTSLREKVKSLERLLYDPVTPCGQGGPLTPPQLLFDLPLWRVQWAVLPGFQVRSTTLWTLTSPSTAHTGSPPKKGSTRAQAH